MPEDKNKPSAAADADMPVKDQSIDQNASADTTGDEVVSALQAQLKAAEERHGDVLSNMQNRLGTLGENVDELRHRIPEDLGGKLEGLETGLENLNQRVAQIWSPEGSELGEVSEQFAPGDVESGDVPDQHSYSDTSDEMSEVQNLAAGSKGDDTAGLGSVESEAGVTSGDVETIADDDTGVDEGDAFPASSDPVEDTQAVREAPAALRSAATVEEGASESEEVATKRHAYGVDTFDMVDTSVPGDPDSPWDRDSAEALAQLYDTSQQHGGHDEPHGMPARTPDPESTDVAMDTASPAPAAAYDNLETTPAHDPIDAIDRDWLNSKFTEIAERIEQTLAELDPKKTAAEFDQRMQSMEDRFGTVLQDVATRSDVEGLRELESHVSGMAAQLTHTETQMQRLDSIEGTLHEVVARFTESQAGASFADMEGATAQSVDPHQVAEVAAARIADHLAASGASGDHSAITDVRNMIEGFLNEHRQGNEQTSLMLDTIQQAMIRILDRLDVLETAGGIVSQPGAEAPVEQPEMGAQAVAAAEGWAEPGQGHGSDDDIELTDPVAVPQMTEDEEASVEIHPRDTAPTESAAVAQHSESPNQVGASELAGSGMAQPEVPQQTLAGSELPQTEPGAGAHASPDLLSDRSDAVVMPAEAAATSRDAIDKIRHNFIADAQQAKAQAAQSVAQPIVEPAKKVGRASLLAGIKQGSQDGASKGGFFGTKSRRLLLGALLAVIAIQGAIFLMPSSETSTVDVEVQTGAPSAAGEPSGLERKTQGPADPNKSSFLSPGDGFSPAVSSDVLVNDVHSAIEDAHHHATGAADLPFGLMLQQTTAKEWTQKGRPIFNKKESAVTPVALKTDQVGSGSRVYKAPSKAESDARAKLPPLTVGPTSLRMAAAKGDPSAQFEVGTRMSEGKGTNQNFKQAAVWFKRSASQGFAQAQYRLGTLYERGLGVAQDVNRAQMWYLRAAEQGNIRAMHNLAVLSAGQASGKPDYDRAAQWFVKAAENGLPDSQFNAGVLFENGLGVSKDLIQAYKWYTLAAQNGDEESLKRAQKLRSKLTIEALGQAESDVRSFKPGKVDPLANNARIAGQDWKKRQNS